MHCFALMSYRNAILCFEWYIQVLCKHKFFNMNGSRIHILWYLQEGPRTCFLKDNRGQLCSIIRIDCGMLFCAVKIQGSRMGSTCELLWILSRAIRESFDLKKSHSLKVYMKYTMCVWGEVGVCFCICVWWNQEQLGSVGLYYKKL